MATIVKLQSNVVANTAEGRQSIGVLNALLGKEGTFELWSSANFHKPSSRLLVRGTNKKGEQFKFTCSTAISEQIRNAETEDEFDALLDSLATTSVYQDERQDRDFSGKLRFDENDEPIMNIVYYLGADGQQVDMKTTRKTITSIKQVEAQPATEFEWERRA